MVEKGAGSTECPAFLQPKATDATPKVRCFLRLALSLHDLYSALPAPLSMLPALALPLPGIDTANRKGASTIHPAQAVHCVFPAPISHPCVSQECDRHS